MTEDHIHSLEGYEHKIRLHLPCPTDHVQKQILQTGRFYEEDMLRHAAMSLSEGDLVIDVGAYIGTHSVYFGRLCGARVMAFEPNPRSAEILQQNLRLNGLEQQVQVIRKGVGSTPGRAALVPASDDNQGMTQLDTGSEGAIEIMRLDDIEFGQKVKLVKIDVEGMELDVLEGMRGLLKSQPILYIETVTFEQMSAVNRILKEFGYCLIENFNITPTYCFMPVSTDAQRFEALMARWDASIHSRVRVEQPSLTTSQREFISEISNRLLQERERQDDKIHKRIQGLAADQKHLLKKWSGDIKDHVSAQVDVLQRQLEISLRNEEHLRSSLASQSQRLDQALEILLKKRGILSSLVRYRNPLRLAAKALRNRRKKKRKSRQVQREEDGREAAPPDDLVTVVMTSYNSAQFIEKAVRSVLAQSHPQLELLVVDDASCDDTVELLGKIQADDARLRILRNYKNRGTYWCKNLGMLHARGRYIAFQDSDDVSDPARIRRQLMRLQREGAVISTSNYVRQDPDGKFVLNRGLEQRLGLITLLFEKQPVLDQAGFFDCVRTSADDEFLHRLKLVFARTQFAHVDEQLYIALVRSDSLTGSGAVNLSADAESGDDLGFLTPVRRSYVEAYRRWHQECSSPPYLSFPPPRKRPFEVPAPILPEQTPGPQFVTASLASIPERTTALNSVVQSLVDQVDQLNVYLNNYSEVPSFLNHPKIRVERSQDHGDLRDNGKFFFLADAADGYYFTVDDDIAYPSDYVRYMVAKLQQYGHQAVVGFHGTIFQQPIESFLDPKCRTVLSFKHALAEDRPVHLLGSGTTGWQTSTLKLSLDQFETTGMADLWLAIQAKRQSIPMISISREHGFLAPIPDLDSGSLYEEFKGRDEQQTAIARAQEPWTFHELSDPGKHQPLTSTTSS